MKNIQKEHRLFLIISLISNLLLGSFLPIVSPVHAFDLSSPLDIVTYPDKLLLRPNAAAVDSNGIMYIADKYRLIKYDGSVWSVFLDSTANGVATDSSNNIYITTDENIKKYVVSTSTWITYGSYGTANGQFKNPSGIVVDSNNDIYVADMNNHRVQKLTQSGDTISWSVTYGSTTHSTDLGMFWYPSQVSIDSSHNLYVADSGNGRYQKFDGNTWTAVSTTGSALGTFSVLTGIAVDDSGNIYVADSGNYRVLKYNGVSWSAIATFHQTTIGNISLDQNNHLLITLPSYQSVNMLNLGDLSSTTYGGDNESEIGRFDQPVKVAFNPTDSTMYVAEMARVQKFDGTTWSVFLEYWDNENQYLSNVRSVAVDHDGYVYISDSDMYKLYKVNSTATEITTIFDGTGGSTDGYDLSPKGIFVDSSDNVYFVAYESTDNETRIYKYLHASSELTLIATVAANSDWSWPEGITLDASGDIYVANSANCNIKKYTVSSTLWSTIGSTDTCGSGTGLFDTVNDIAFDSDGNLYATNHDTTTEDRIEKISSDLSTWTSYGVTGTDDEDFKAPTGLTFDPDGNLWVADTDNYRLVKLVYFESEDSGGGSPTPTPTPTETVLSSLSPASNNSTPPTCGDIKPLGTPNLFQIDVKGTQATLYYSPLSDQNSDYFISYSEKSNTFQHSTFTGQKQSSGVLSFTINHLKPNTTYYFKVRGQNGCMPGDFSNEMSAKTKNTGLLSLITYYKNSPKIASLISTKASPKPSPQPSAQTVTSSPTTTPAPTNTTTPTPVQKIDTPVPTQKSCFLFWCW